MNELTKKIIKILDDHKISYDTFEHAKAMSCEEAATLRSMPLKFGGKSILFKDKNGFKLFTLAAHKKVDNTKVRKILKSQKLRFATNEELKSLAGVEKGALSPIGKKLYPFDHYIDNSILENEYIVFNAAVITLTVVMKVSDYLKIVEAQFCDFSK